MKDDLKYIIILFCSLVAFSSCENESQKRDRLEREELQKIELEAQMEQEAEVLASKQEQERQEQAIRDKYINNSLNTGETPYSYCFGKNKACTSYGCSEIIVKTPFNSDVLVTIKKNDQVYRHAYINASSNYSFEMPNGTYQAFFYYGRGWNPEKIMKETDCGLIKGGFVDNELFSKDDAQSLSNEIITYELILQENGNLKTEPSDAEEAL